MDVKLIIKQERCRLQFGVSPCTASGDVKCYNTRTTCRDIPNIDLQEQELIFTTSGVDDPGSSFALAGGVSLDVPARASIEDAKIVSGNMPLEGVASENKATITMVDDVTTIEYDDVYRNERANEGGSRWGRLLARNRLLHKATAELWYRRTGRALAHLSSDWIRTYWIVDSITYPRDYRVTVSLVDPVTRKLDTPYPVRTPSQLITLIADLARDATAINEDPLVFSDAPGDVYRIGRELLRRNTVAEPDQWVRGQLGTEAQDHRTGDVAFPAETIDGVWSDVYEAMFGQVFSPNVIDVTDKTIQAPNIDSIRVRGVISREESFREMLAELCLAGQCSIYFDIYANAVRFRANTGFEALGVFVGENDHLMVPVVSSLPGRQKSRTALRYDPRNHIDFQEYRRYVLTVDNDVEASLGYTIGDSLESRFVSGDIRSDTGVLITRQDSGEVVAARRTQRYSTLPLRVRCRLSAEEYPLLRLGDRVLLQYRQGYQNTTGAPIDADFVVTDFSMDLIQGTKEVQGIVVNRRDVVIFPDNPNPFGITIRAVRASVTEGDVAEFIILSHDNGPEGGLQILLDIAVTGGDYLAPGQPQSVLLLAGEDTVTLEVMTRIDTASSSPGVVIVRVLANMNLYEIGNPNTASVSVVKTGTGPGPGGASGVNIIANSLTVDEGENAEFTVRIPAIQAVDTVVNVNVYEPEDQEPSYITAGSHAVTVPSGGLNGALSIPTIANLIREQDGTVIAEITSVPSGFDIGQPNPATITVLDDDVFTSTPVLTIVSGVGASVTEGAIVRFRILSSLPIPEGGYTVVVSVAVNGGVTINGSLPTAVTMLAGQMQRDFEIRTTEDVHSTISNGSIVATLPPATLYNVGSPNSASVTVVDSGVGPDPGPPDTDDGQGPEVGVLALGDAVIEGEPVRFRVRSIVAVNEDDAMEAPITVSLEVTQAGNYIQGTPPANVVINPSRTGTLNNFIEWTGDGEVATDNDSTDEGDGSITVRVLDGPGYQPTIRDTSVGRPAITTIVRDNDDPPPPPPDPSGCPPLPGPSLPVITVNIAGSSGPVNVYNRAQAPQGQVRVNVNFMSGSVLGASGVPAVTIDGFAAGSLINIRFSGTVNIIGWAGEAGTGGTEMSQDGGNGGNGGDAFVINGRYQVRFESGSANICGGGGGGGGGGYNFINVPPVPGFTGGFIIHLNGFTGRSGLGYDGTSVVSSTDNLEANNADPDGTPGAGVINAGGGGGGTYGGGGGGGASGTANVTADVSGGPGAGGTPVFITHPATQGRSGTPGFSSGGGLGGIGGPGEPHEINEVGRGGQGGRGGFHVVNSGGFSYVINNANITCNGQSVSFLRGCEPVGQTGSPW